MATRTDNFDLDFDRYLQEKLVNYSSLKENDLRQQCSNELFRYISQKIYFEFGLAVSLGLEQHDIEQIKENQAIKDKVIKMFWKWKEIRKSKATQRTLIKALYEDQNLNAIEELLEYLEIKKQSEAPSIPSIMSTLSPDENKDDSQSTEVHETRVTYQTQHSLPSPRPFQAPPTRSSSYSPGTRKDTSVCAKKLDNDGWKLIEDHYDEIIKVLCLDEDLCKHVLQSLYEYMLIDVAEKQIIEKLPCIKMRSKALLGYALIRISKARNYIGIFAKFASVLQQFTQFENVCDQLKKEALAYKIVLKSTGPRRTDIGKSIKEKETTSTSSSTGATISGCDDEINTPAIKKYSRHLKRLYSSKFKPDPKWSPSDPNFKIFVDLAVVKSSNHPCNDTFSKSTIRGTIDDIIQQKTPLTFNELCDIPYGSTILIEGAPGIGKSMLAYEMCIQWAAGNNLTNYSLLLLLRLRDNQIQKLATIRDVLGYYLHEQSWKEEAIQDIIDNSGEGVLIILEGFDELPVSIAERNSIFVDLAKTLPFSTAVYTSRPSARHFLMSKDLIFSPHVEVIGFTKESITKYTESFFNNDHFKIDRFNSILEKSPKVASCLYIPINLAIVCSIFADHKTIPIEGNVTSTKLYEALIKMLLYRHMKNEDQSKLVFIERLDKLPDEDIQASFLELCKLAYEGLINKEITTKLTFDIPETMNRLDLMQKEVVVIPGGGDVIVYSFLHLTIQEFLAALYITIKLPRKIQHHFKNYLRVKNLSTMLQFLAGLTKLKSCSLKPDNDMHNLNTFQFLAEAENDDLTKKIFGQRDHPFKVSRILPKATQHDMYILGRSIALSQCKWELSFTLRGMTSEHIEQFKEGLSAIRPLSTQEIHEISFSLNEIGNEGLIQILHFPAHFLRHLLSLRLVSTELDQQCIDMFVQHLSKLTKLKKLHLNNNYFNEGDQLPLLEILSTLLHIEDVSFSKLNQEECSTLLTKFPPSLKILDLYQLSSLSIEAVFLHLPRSISLQKLYLRQSLCTCDILSQYLPQALATCHQLKVIEFINCNIDTSCVPVICEAVQQAPELERLSLEDNYIDNEGAVILCDMMQQLSSPLSPLVELDVRHNPFTERGVSTFIDVFRSLHCTSNFTLYLSIKWEPFVRRRNCPTADKHIMFIKTDK